MIRSVSRRGSGGLADFSAFYREHADRVSIYLAKRCLDPEVALDLMAETFAQAFEGRGRYRGTSDAEAAGWVVWDCTAPAVALPTSRQG